MIGVAPVTICTPASVKDWLGRELCHSLRDIDIVLAINRKFAAVRKWRPLQRRRGRSGALRLAEVAGAAVATMADEKPKEGVKTENNEHINLKVAGQDGSVVQFKIKRHTPLSKLMKAYCERQTRLLPSQAQ
ncbi:hypothetical protein ATANTOWER_025966 [Ataeniobius toweri]|uniref:Rad60/SUMO-like domain-containing protein n=1 Tax=Ataeniobius toweri TaxID=208326 RepID=A0ABU7B0G6_9TELE|nr:hypothetical protein [Ataeniobius toweri]